MNLTSQIIQQRQLSEQMTPVMWQPAKLKRGITKSSSLSLVAMETIMVYFVPIWRLQSALCLSVVILCICIYICICLHADTIFSRLATCQACALLSRAVECSTKEPNLKLHMFAIPRTVRSLWLKMLDMQHITDDCSLFVSSRPFLAGAYAHKQKVNPDTGCACLRDKAVPMLQLHDEETVKKRTKNSKLASFTLLLHPKHQLLLRPASCLNVSRMWNIRSDQPWQDQTCPGVAQQKNRQFSLRGRTTLISMSEARPHELLRLECKQWIPC